MRRALRADGESKPADVECPRTGEIRHLDRNIAIRSELGLPACSAAQLAHHPKPPAVVVVEVAARTVEAAVAQSNAAPARRLVELVANSRCWKIRIALIAPRVLEHLGRANLDNLTAEG